MDASYFQTSTRELVLLVTLVLRESVRTCAWLALFTFVSFLILIGERGRDEFNLDCIKFETEPPQHGCLLQNHILNSVKAINEVFKKLKRMFFCDFNLIAHSKLHPLSPIPLCF